MNQLLPYNYCNDIFQFLHMLEDIYVIVQEHDGSFEMLSFGLG